MANAPLRSLRTIAKSEKTAKTTRTPERFLGNTRECPKSENHKKLYQPQAAAGG